MQPFMKFDPCNADDGSFADNDVNYDESDDKIPSKLETLKTGGCKHSFPSRLASLKTGVAQNWCLYTLLFLKIALL